MNKLRGVWRATIQRARRRNESGQAGAEAVAMAIIFGVFIILLFANIWTVVDTKMRASDAARDIARQLVESPADKITDANAKDILANQPWKARQLVGQPVAAMLELTGPAVRCSRVVVAVTVRVKAVIFPFAKNWAPGFTVGARHSELVDPFRSDLPGDGLCVPVPP
jgi:Flp pilus assembly protein TadG